MNNHYGLTWVSSEPWGYAPYHYGRWANVNNQWYWVPEGLTPGRHTRRRWWRLCRSVKTRLVGYRWVRGRVRTAIL